MGSGTRFSEIESYAGENFCKKLDCALEELAEAFANSGSVSDHPLERSA
ncbi:hypothetical protein LBWT_Y0180 (plasmid) [Leptolyngbya boryana IAM M-101]|nr:hypothetical protein LBWT_Y0180 [Leptolyngbya boryana IAM M-101]BAS66778.1 hypothetical protein LBDG_Y0180 [Leptolyngbya boryana dg5]